MTYDGEALVDNNFTSSPHPLIVFGRDGFVLVKAKSLPSNISMHAFIKTFFNWWN